MTAFTHQRTTKTPAKRLVAMGGLATLIGLSAATDAAAQAPPAPTPAELVYTPVAPCRVFDTRTRFKIPANKAYNFQITGSTNMAAQGGPATGCGVPASAASVALSVTAVHAGNAGSLAAYAFGAPKPGVNALNYQADVAATAGLIAPIASGKLAVFSSQSVNVSGDVTGYFAPAIQATINENGTIRSATSRILSSGRTSTGLYQLQADRDLTSCVAIGSPLNTGDIFVTTQTYSGGLFVNVFALAPNNLTPQATDGAFYVLVTC